MGRRGPKPKSPTIKILEGNPGGHPIDDGGVNVKSAVPRCPTKYEAPGRHIWKSLGKRLADAGILTALDAFALEMLVDAYLAWSEATKNADLIRTEKAAQHLRLCLREFGLTPASRSSVKSAEPKEKKTQPDPASRYFA